MANLGKYSFGVGDRFGRQAKAQLSAVLKIREQGIDVVPVWNKSHREHTTVGTNPESLRNEADDAVKKLRYKGVYLVDADHINKETVKDYIEVSDFFTIDVAEFIGKASSENEKQKFRSYFEKYTEEFNIPGINRNIKITDTELEKMLDTFLLAMNNAAEVYQVILNRKGKEFFTEVSIDEVANPQSPEELFVILAALAFYKVPVNTIAPKFTGAFNKGVDYEGDISKFEQEFEEDLLVLKYAINEFGLPDNLKLSVHSGSDKFSIYPVINKLIKKRNSGLHLKTAGTTWLEELIGLAESGGEAFEFARDLYKESLERFDELTRDYTSVLSIDREKLPAPEDFNSGKEFANMLRHDKNSELYNPHFRQLLHCAYKIAAEKGDQFFDLLKKHRAKIEENVTYNLYERHLKSLYL